MKRLVLAMTAILAMGTLLSACSKHEGPAQKAGKKIDQAVEKAGKEVNKAADKTGDAIKDAGQAVKNKTDN